MASLLVNTTFFAVLACFVVVIIGWIAGWSPVVTLDRLRGAITSWPVITLLFLGSFLNCAFRIYAGSLNPGDFMQDIVAARQFLTHESMYPRHIGALVAQELAQHPPIIEFHGIPKRIGDFAAVKLNAHPPITGLLLAPLLYLMNFRWIYLLLTACSVISLVGMIFMILGDLGIPSTRRDFLALTFLALGWHPVLSTIRSGQSSIIISALITFAWFSLRKKKSFQAGAIVGIAAAIKLYPGLLIAYFLLRNRRAFAGGLVTFLTAQLVTIGFCGVENYREFLETMFFLSHPFYSRTNMSLVAFIMGFLHVGGLGFLIMLGGISLLAYWMAMRRESSATEDLDIEYALCVVMQLLLTPIAWSHYLVALILPLAILANWLLQRELRWSAITAYLGLLVCFSIPDTSVKFAQIVVQRLAGYYVGWLLTSTFTAGLLLLCAWLAFLAVPRRNAQATAG